MGIFWQIFKQFFCEQASLWSLISLDTYCVGHSEYLHDVVVAFLLLWWLMTEDPSWDGGSPAVQGSYKHTGDSWCSKVLSLHEN